MLGDEVTVGRVQERIAATLERLETRRDPRAVFLTWYALTTEGVQDALRSQRFAQGAFIERLVSHLADHYFITMLPESADRSLVTPPAWHAAHQRPAHGVRRGASEWLALGVNAQISNDLPQAIATVLRSDWAAYSKHLNQIRADMSIFMMVLADATVCATAALKRGGCTETAQHAVHRWGDDAWSAALELATSANSLWWGAQCEEIECTSLRRAHLLSCPIPGRMALLVAPSRQLNHLFPVRHGEPACRLLQPLPVWGTRAPAPFLDR